MKAISQRHLGLGPQHLPDVPFVLLLVIPWVVVIGRSFSEWGRLWCELGLFTVVALSRAMPCASPKDRPHPVVSSVAFFALILALAIAGTMTLRLSFGAQDGLELHLPTGFWASRVVLFVWALSVGIWGEMWTRTLGVYPMAFWVVFVTVLVMLLGPLLANPLHLGFPGARTPLLVLSAPVSMGRAMGMEVFHLSPLYRLSALGILEFRYPQWYTHVVAMVMLTVCTVVAARLWLVFGVKFRNQPQSS